MRPMTVLNQRKRVAARSARELADALEAVARLKPRVARRMLVEVPIMAELPGLLEGLLEQPPLEEHR